MDKSLHKHADRKKVETKEEEVCDATWIVYNYSARLIRDVHYLYTTCG